MKAILLLLIFKLIPCALSMIPGGTLTQLYPEVVMINENCTGTMVSSNVILTAAHCFSPPRAARKLKSHGYQEMIKVNQSYMEGKIYFQSETINPYQKDYSSKITNALNDTNVDFDLALIIFKHSLSETFLPLIQNSPQVGEKISLLGYGWSNYNNSIDDHQKRIGRNQILEVLDHAILIRGKYYSGNQNEFDQNATLYGDSGGPLINGMGEVVGVLSGWVLFGGKRKKSAYQYKVKDLGINEEISLYQRVDTIQVKKWIQDTLAYDLAQP